MAESQRRIGRSARPSTRHGPLPPNPPRRDCPHATSISACCARLRSVVHTCMGPRRRVRSRRPPTPDQAPCPWLNASVARSGRSALCRATRSNPSVVALRCNRRTRRRPGCDLDNHSSLGIRRNWATPDGRAVPADPPRRGTPCRCRSRRRYCRSSLLSQSQGSWWRSHYQRCIEHSRFGIASRTPQFWYRSSPTRRGSHVASRPKPGRRHSRCCRRYVPECCDTTTPD